MYNWFTVNVIFHAKLGGLTSVCTPFVEDFELAPSNNVLFSLKVHGLCTGHITITTNRSYLKCTLHPVKSIPKQLVKCF